VDEVGCEQDPGERVGTGSHFQGRKCVLMRICWHARAPSRHGAVVSTRFNDEYVESVLGQLLTQDIVEEAADRPRRSEATTKACTRRGSPSATSLQGLLIDDKSPTTKATSALSRHMRLTLATAS
jgi:hypothetical protein